MHGWSVNMPYYIGAGEPEWDEYMEIAEDVAGPPISLFKYVEPWTAMTAVLPFPETPGPRPQAEKTDPAPRQLSPEQMLERFQNEQKHLSELALWELSSATAKCRDNGIKRVFGAYDGGGDESFAHFRSIEMSDGRVISAEPIDEETKGINCSQLIEQAAFALMGRHDAGEFFLRGALVIDFHACTITDEKDFDVVFGEQDVRDN
jgi:hypothetical protein